jgi:hypothetical protein
VSRKKDSASKRSAPSPAPPEGYQVLLSDGGIRVVPPTPWNWLRLRREEWRVRPDLLEVTQTTPGWRHRRRYTGGTLWIEPCEDQGRPGHRLVVRAREQRRTLATGDLQRVHALGGWLSQQLGWRLRVVDGRPILVDRWGLRAVGIFLLIGGLLAGSASYWTGQRETRRVRALSPITALELSNLPLGTSALATGAIGGPTSRRDAGFVLYDVTVSRVVYRGSRAWERSEGRRTGFQIYQPGGTLPVARAPSHLIRPPHRVSSDFRQVEGFQVGDPVTVDGTVVLEHGTRALAPRIVFGGTPKELARTLERQGRGLGLMGLLAAAVGGLLAWQGRLRRR